MTGNRYNRIFGENSYADVLLDMIGLTRADFPRYRDVFTSKDGAHIVVYTRSGGVFKKYYQDMTKRLGMHPLILHACDDRQDSTYHYITFTVPMNDRERTEDIFLEQGEVVSVSDKFTAVGREMATMSREQMREDPRFAEDIKMMDNACTMAPGTVINTQDDDVPAGYDIMKEGIRMNL